VPQIEVTFDLDASGILNVTAKDKATGRAQSIRITGSTGLSKEEIERMTKEAEAHAEEDRKRKEMIEVRNNADSLVYTAEKTLKEAKEKVNPEVKERVETEIKKVKELLEKEGVTKEEIEEATRKLSEELQKVGAAMYSSAEAPKGSEGGSTQEGSSSAKASEDKKEAEEGEVVE